MYIEKLTISLWRFVYLFACVNYLSNSIILDLLPSGALETGSCLNLQSSHLTH